MFWLFLMFKLIYIVDFSGNIEYREKKLFRESGRVRRFLY